MKKLSILITVIIVFLIAAAVWWANGNAPVDPKSEISVIFVVSKGDGIREIANNLKAKRLIKSRIVFFLTIKQLNLDKKIQAGDFRLSPKMKASEIAQNLTHGTLDIWITIPEGKRTEEIAEILKKEISSYDPSWQSILRSNEGYLFPDTYLIPKDADIKTIISIMKNNFNAKIKSINLSQNNNRLREIIIIASLIEREALGNNEKSIIASVIANRLKVGMSLDIDATLQYIKGKDATGKWWSIPTIEDKEINSPYNTYKNPGLPPFPISNPGLEAIKAAVNHQVSNYYYYIHDSNGNVHFARTLEDHNLNIKKYNIN
ncbi:MAG: endolytic transglycosylase MltG [Patescibacteria group bacterium]